MPASDVFFHQVMKTSYPYAIVTSTFQNFQVLKIGDDTNSMEDNTNCKLKKFTQDLFQRKTFC